MKPLTHAQELTLAFICDYIEDKGYPPTIREIAEGTEKASVSTAHSHIHALQRKGYISATGSPRAIKVHQTVTGRWE